LRCRAEYAHIKRVKLKHQKRKSLNLFVSDEAREKLDRLVPALGRRSRSDVVEVLILEKAAQRPIEQKRRAA